MDSEFESIGLFPSLVEVTHELGYRRMTPIQAQAIPALLAGDDLIGQAQTGSGKTAAFSLPLLQSIDLKMRMLQGLVLVPTRELATQVAREIRRLGSKHAGLQVLIVTGGLPSRPQRLALNKGVHIVVGTPGRVLDLLERAALHPETITTAILDEADRMLDMGFAEEMNRILTSLPRRRQTAFFSATFPDRIEEMSSRHQRRAVRITIEDAPDSSPNIRQVALLVTDEQKLAALYHALNTAASLSTLIFCSTKATVAELASSMAKAKIECDCLHGDLEQFERDSVLAMFRNQSTRVLIATDVAARGIDIEKLDLVVNYDLPSKPEVYVHRIGRTGRAGMTGLAISLVSPTSEYKLDHVEKLTSTQVERQHPKAMQLAEEANLAAATIGPPHMVTIQIGAGRQDKLRPGDILGALTGQSGQLRGDDVGKIEILDRRAFVAVKASLGRMAVDRLNRGGIKGRHFRATLIDPSDREASPWDSRR